VVGSSSGEISWVIETTGGGVVFPEGDVPALAKMIADLRNDDRARRELAARGLEGVWQHFTPRVAAGALDDLVRSAIPRPSPPSRLRVPAGVVSR
jgi:hypothetical protein